MVYRGYQAIDLNQHREKYSNVSSKVPFQHQIEAFQALGKTFNLKNEKPGSGILVLPTGAGKTFTAVRWLSTHVIAKNMKILWLAPSYYLLNQAFETFYENAREIPQTKARLNIRLVSSNSEHSHSGSIDSTDDIIIMTMQTAIKNLHLQSSNGSGKKKKTPFREFVDNCQKSGLFVVVDEAHHVPADGCRKLLIGEDISKLGLRGLVSNLHLLGLTATPTYTDKTKRGWLWEIFKDGVIYEADKTKLTAEGILARPNYIEVSTGKQWEVDDELYNRLVKQHKDLPEEIIQQLADDNDRNSFIVNNYVEKKDEYGKTIIFADRWYQCIYIAEQLKKHQIKAEAIYSQVNGKSSSVDERNKRSPNENTRILKQFKTGKDENGNDAPIDVLVNIRMLTEGADVPNVKTIFVTRQTTSTILINQMIGRGLRGKKVGGSDEANVVLFFDDWKRLINWATIEGGGTDDSQPNLRKEYQPFEYISIRLIEELSRQIDGVEEHEIQYSQVLPIGWYKTEIYDNSDDNSDSVEKFTEFVLVYEHTKSKFQKFIEFIIKSNLSDKWSQDSLDNELIQPQIKKWIHQYFDYDNDDIGNQLGEDIIRIVRHIAENKVEPEYHSFVEREQYDINKLARKLMELNSIEQIEYLKKELETPDTLWKTFYKSLHRFKTAVDATINSILSQPEPIITPPPPLPPILELTKAEKEQVKRRDGYNCLCCGANGQVVILEIDHIKPKCMGGETTIENSQTLCRICNRAKGTDEIDFRLKQTPLAQRKSLEILNTYKSSNVTQTLTRIINFYYHCHAVDQINWHSKTKGAKFYYILEIHLYAGNNPEWLIQGKVQILNFIKYRLYYDHVQDFKIMTRWL